MFKKLECVNLNLTEHVTVKQKILTRRSDIMRRQINTIFCATDFSKFAEEVVAYGITLAKEFNAKLIVCHVVDFPTVL